MIEVFLTLFGVWPDFRLQNSIIRELIQISSPLCLLFIGFFRVSKGSKFYFLKWKF